MGNYLPTLPTPSQIITNQRVSEKEKDKIRTSLSLRPGLFNMTDTTKTIKLEEWDNTVLANTLSQQTLGNLKQKNSIIKALNRGLFSESLPNNVRHIYFHDVNMNVVVAVENNSGSYDQSVLSYKIH